MAIKNSIFGKIFGFYLLVIIPVTGIILFLVFSITHEHYLKTIKNDLESLSYSIQDQLRPLIESNDTMYIESKVKAISKYAHARITVITPKGNVIADSDEEPVRMENHATRLEIAEAMSGKEGTSVRYSHTVKKNMMYIALPFYEGKEIKAITRVSLYINRIDELYSILREKILLVILIATSFSIIVLFYFSRNLTVPIKELATASQKFASGDFNTKVFIDNNDELRGLADSFNQMTDKVKQSFENQSMQQEQLKRIVSSLQEGLIVIDKDNKIVLNNKSFKHIVNQSEINGKLYWEVLRDINVQNLVEKIRKKKTHKTAEIKIEEYYYLCSANYIQTKDEIVIVLFDISERRQLEEMKKDFVVNASHELRTPLTAIKGFIETMEDDAGGEQIKYLDVIKRHTSRLINIVEDLLTISKLEDEKNRLQISNINFDNLLSDVLTIFDERLKEKDIKLSHKVDESIKDYKGDFFKIEQLFINLIDNAIKYTQKGNVKIVVVNSDAAVKIDISDTGIGIPVSEQSRIFERFYTVDKSRSRKSGGTGLGLSIVKHIVNLHQGSIDVESLPGNGTTFRILLPKQMV